MELSKEEQQNIKNAVPSTPKVRHGSQNKKVEAEGNSYNQLLSDESIIEEDRSSVVDKDKKVSINLNKNF